MPNPELPYLAAGSVSIIGGAIAEHQWPSNGVKSAIATVILVIIASASAGSRIAPLVHAVGILLFMVAAMAAIKQNTHGKKT